MYKIEPLAQHPQLYNQVIKLIEKAYQYSPDESFEVDFCPLINKKNWENCFLIFANEGNELIGHIGCKPRYLQLKHQKISCVFLGGIALEKKYRGKGIFKKSFEQILSNLSRTYEYAILWSDQLDLYKKFKFNTYYFSQLKLSNKQHPQFTPPIGYEKIVFQNLSKKNQMEIKDLYEKYVNHHHISVFRSEEDWKELMSIKSASMFVKYSENKIQSYFILGKGQDLQGIIHEYAFNDTNTEITQEFSENSVLIHQNEKSKNWINIPSALIKNLKGSKFLEDYSSNESLYISGLDSI